MRKVKSVSITIMAALAVLGLGLGLAGCSAADADTAAAATLTAMVARGNIILDVTAAGNLSFSTIETPAFATAGTVAEVLVEVSDTVSEGDVLARLDSATLDDQISQLEDKVDTAESQVTAREEAISQDEDNVADARQALADAPAERELQAAQVLQAAADLEAARVTVLEAPDDAAATLADLEETLYNANTDLLKAQDTLEASPSYDAYVMNLRALHVAQVKVAAAQEAVDEAPAAARKELAAREKAVLQAQVNYNNELKTQAALATDAELQAAVEKAQAQVESDQKALEKARTALAAAQEDLAETEQYSLEVVAPFDGFITKVNVSGGDEVTKGTVAVEIADPTQFQVDIMIGESDIADIAMGGQATVTIDSISGLSYPATISFISPTSTNSSGVVKYQVTVDLDTANPQYANQRSPAGAADATALPSLPSGTMPTDMPADMADFTGRPSFSGGDVTMPTDRPTGRQSTTGTETAAEASAAVTVASQLKEGLSVSISVILLEKDDVLLVPNEAIVQQMGVSYVTVPGGDTTALQQVSVGVSDYDNTEITSGLSEGDQVVYTQSAGSGSSSQGSFRSGMGGMMIGGF